MAQIDPCKELIYGLPEHVGGTGVTVGLAHAATSTTNRAAANSNAAIRRNVCIIPTPVFTSFSSLILISYLTVNG